MAELHALVLAQYDRMIGLELDDVAVDGCITKAPGGGEVVGRSPVDRGNAQGAPGLKRSVLVEGAGVPLAVVAAGANRHDTPLPASTLTGLERWSAEPAARTVHLDRGDDRHWASAAAASCAAGSGAEMRSTTGASHGPVTR